MNGTSPGYRVAHTSAAGFDAFLAELRKNAKATGGTAWDQIRQREAIISHDIPRELGLTMEQAARMVQAKLLVIIASEDHRVNPQPAKQFGEAIGAAVITVNSPCGHLSLACVSAGAVVARFLADPSSAHSETLSEAGQSR
jgi:homoserine O-acetyltransferase